MSGKTMIRTVLRGPKDIYLERSEIPSIGPDEVLVRLRAGALCTWEQRTYQGIAKNYPLLGGHESAGTVEAVGSQVLTKVKVGDKVAVAFLTRCMQCESCRRGYTNICDNLRAGDEPGKPFGPGGLSQYAVVKGYQVYKLADHLSFAEGSLAEPLACVVHSVRRANIQPGETVVIVGAGIMGLFHLLLAKERGARVVVSELIELRREMAQRLGADAVIDPHKENYVQQVRELTDGWGADVTFCAIGVSQIIEEAVQAAAKRGRVMVYAAVYPHGSTITLDPNLFHHREIVLTGSMSQDQDDFQQAVNLLNTGALDVKPFISKVFPLGQIEAAFQASLSLDTYRVIVDPWDGA
ncbi:MAG: zinc-binding dehydrogenase [Chloroflexi bacterium]|nr:zinc-binding dehydrogenase [Chloroflexota bacterium]